MMFELRASDVRLRRENNATAGGYTSSVTYGDTANIAEGNFDAACRFPLLGEGLQALCVHSATNFYRQRGQGLGGA
jgi:hypothetical protein